MTRGIIPPSDISAYFQYGSFVAPRKRLTKSIGNTGRKRTRKSAESFFPSPRARTLSPALLPLSRFSTYSPPRNQPSRYVTVISSAIPARFIAIAEAVGNAMPTEIYIIDAGIINSTDLTANTPIITATAAAVLPAPATRARISILVSLS